MKRLERLHDVGVKPFEEVVAEHGDVVMRVCRALLGPVDAADAWSETFLAALRTYPDLRPDSNVRGWLVTIAHRKAIDEIRRSGRHATPLADLPEAPIIGGDPLDGEFALNDERLRNAVTRLADKQRYAVTYRYLADLSYADVAALLECSEAAARRSASDGIANLRNHMSKGTQ